MENSPELKALIRKNAHLFWYTKDSEKENLSLSVVLEFFINYADKEAIKELFAIVGIKSVADVFFDQISKSERAANNYELCPEIFSVFTLRNMHLEILNKEQRELLPFIKKYSKKYYLVGGTAIALHIGHRVSIDFDLFTAENVNTLYIKKQVGASQFSARVIVEKADQIHFTINNVKLTFFRFPFFINANLYHQSYFKIPDLLTLAAMKAFALGGRGKWKDYVDLYFMIKNHFTIGEICDKAKELFTDVFNPTLFNKQLTYFDDISFEEQIEFMPGFEVSEQQVKDFLIDAALTGF